MFWSYFFSQHWIIIYNLKQLRIILLLKIRLIKLCYDSCLKIFSNCIVYSDNIIQYTLKTIAGIFYLTSIGWTYCDSPVGKSNARCHTVYPVLKNRISEVCCFPWWKIKKVKVIKVIFVPVICVKILPPSIMNYMKENSSQKIHIIVIYMITFYYSIENPGISVIGKSKMRLQSKTYNYLGTCSGKCNSSPEFLLGGVSPVKTIKEFVVIK